MVDPLPSQTPPVSSDVQALDADGGEGSDRQGRPPVLDVGVPRWVRSTAVYSWAFVGLALATAGLAYALVWMATIVIPLVVALFLTALLGSPTGWLRRRGLPSALAVLLVLGLTALLVVGAIVYVEQRAATEFGSVDFSLDQGLEKAERRLTSLGIVSSQQLSEAAVAAKDQFISSPARLPRGERTSALLSGALAGFSALTEAALALFILFFFLLEGDRIWAFFVGLVPARRREDFDAVGRGAWAALRAYLGGITLVALFNAVLLLIALYLIGVPLVRSLAIVMFLATFVPVVGSYVAGAVAALVALAFNGGTDALLVVLAVIVIGQIEGNLFHPRVVGRRVNLHPVVIVLVLAAGTTLAGIAGALVAVPLAAMIGASGSYFRSRASGGNELPAPVAGSTTSA
ncbi:MAG: AI-2E family transporter [Solirubrobacteraceae bacterium]